MNEIEVLIMILMFKVGLALLWTGFWAAIGIKVLELTDDPVSTLLLRVLSYIAVVIIVLGIIPMGWVGILLFKIGLP